ncbi:MAG: hypothetical protein HGA75_15575 [Thiobacillus sp.]|nr:hypothetical protein [Thiobacillus sp.]
MPNHLCRCSTRMIELAFIGVGKSSFQDAIQLVMTGGKQHVNVFNSAQDESGGSRAGGKVRRTLASYAVGMRDNLCARPGGSHTYVAAVFAPEEGEAAQAFTAVVAIEAVVSGSLEHGRTAQVARRLFFVLPGLRLSDADFLAHRQGASIDAIKVDEITNRLRLAYPKQAKAPTDRIEDYLCQLYAQFRGGKTLVGPKEAEDAARAFVQSIARKTVGSVDELIREQVLAAPDLDRQIDDIASLMQNVQRLRKIAADLQASKARLTTLKTHADTFVAAFEEAMEAELGEAVRRQRDTEDKLAALEDAKRQAQLDEQRQLAASERHGKALERATGLLGTAQGRLNGNPIELERQRLDQDIARQAGQQTTQATQMLVALDRLRTALGEMLALSQRPNRSESAYRAELDRVVLAVAKIDLAEARAELDAFARGLRAGEFSLAALPRERLATLEARLFPVLDGIQSPGGLAEQVAIEQARQGNLAAVLAKEIEILDKDRQGLDAGEIDLPDPVRDALAYLKARHPETRPRVLCNLVQPREGTRWQNAIEGLLGGNRFLILVEPEYEALAIRAVRHEMPKRPGQREDRKASVVQGSLARKHAEHMAPAPESILNELILEDPTAKSYLLASYGRYVRVRDAEALRGVASGLTVDGMASGGYKMFTAWAEDGDLAFGAEARRKRAIHLGRVIEEKRRALTAAQAEAAGLRTWAERLRRLPSATLLHVLDQLAETNRQLNSLRADRNHLDDASLAGLRRRVARAEFLVKGHIDLKGAADNAKGAAKTKIQETSLRITETAGELDDRRAAVQSVHQRVVEMLRLNGHFNPEALRRRAEEAAASQTPDQFENRRRRQTGLYREHREAFERHLDDHNRLAANLDEKVAYQPVDTTVADIDWRAYGGIPESRKRIAQLLGRLDSVWIVDNARHLTEAEQGFNATFSTHFALAVRTAVEQGIQPLKRLNDKLRRLAFGEDRFEVEYGQMVKEYKPYYDLFQELNRLAETQTPVNLFGAAGGALSEAGATALADIQRLLLDPNREFALRRLKDIADYRNYRHYDIRKYSEDGREASLARMATFSGGELMTPAYLVRAAVLAQAFRQFEKTPSLRLMMIDEAFDKMDEARTAAVMRYLNETLHLQLVVAMPTRASGPLLDLFSFEHRFSLMRVEGRVGELDKITEVDSSVLKTDRLRELWAERRQAVRAEAEREFLLLEARRKLAAEAGGP